MTGLYNFELEGPEVTGYVSGPITATLGGRLAVRLVDQDGYIRNRANGNDEPANEMALARLTLRWTPSETFDFTLKTEYANREVKGGMNVSSPLTTGQRPNDFRFSTQNPIGREGAKVKNAPNLSSLRPTLTPEAWSNLFGENMLRSSGV